jgi:hypothetical protein
MAYRVTDIRLELETNRISISTSLQYYVVIPAVPPTVPPDPIYPDGIPEHDEVRWDKPISCSCKVDPFNTTSLNAAKTTLVNSMNEQLKYWKRLMDKKYELETSGILTTLKTNIMTKLAAIP